MQVSADVEVKVVARDLVQVDEAEVDAAQAVGVLAAGVGGVDGVDVGIRQ